MRKFIIKIGLYLKLYWPVFVGVLAVAVAAYVFWPLLVALAAGVIAAVRHLRKPVDKPVPTPAQKRESERLNRHIENAIEENVGVADIEAVKASQSGARADYFGDAASDAKQRLADMDESKRAEVVARTKERLRNAAKPRNGLRAVVFALALSAGTAQAEEPMKHPHTNESGYWIDHGEKLELDAWVVELDARRNQVDELHAQVNSLLNVASRTRTAVIQCVTLQQSTHAMLRESEAREAKLAAWYRDPRFIGPAGFAAGLALSVFVGWVAL